MACGIIRQYMLFDVSPTSIAAGIFIETGEKPKHTRCENTKKVKCQKTKLANRALPLSTSSLSLIKWRYEEDIEPNPNRYGKLTNLPDYSFVDGRPVPIGMNAYKRMKLQETYCKKIVELSGEIDFAVERYNKMVEASKIEKENLIKSKLRAKGVKLLQKKIDK